MQDAEAREGQTPVAHSKTGRDRLRWVLRFARHRGTSPASALRLFYYAALKPSLAYRGMARYVGDRVVEFPLKVATGRTLHVCARDNGAEIEGIVEFFSPDSKIFPAGLPPFSPQVIYDLGANIGVASLYFSSIYPTARIYAFEPLPRNFEVCARNFQGIPLGEPFPWAVGASTGTAMFDCQNDPRGGRLESSPHDPRLQTLAQIKVQIFTIRDLIHEKRLAPPEFLKVDVEGAELDVLQGLGDDYRSVKRLYIETHGPELKRGCLRWMQERGFKIWPSEDETALWGDRL